MYVIRFRWVACQFDILKHCHNRSAIRRELINLPRTLQATYARIISRVQPEHMPYMTRLLQFLVYSQRPLRLDEAVDAVAVDTNSRPRFDAANRTEIPEEVSAYCAGLIILVKKQAKEGETTTVTEIQLAHVSVQEYLTSGQLEGGIATDLQENVAKLSIVTVCLSYLQDMGHSYTLSKTRQEYPLAQYSARYWAQNAAVIESLDKPVSIREKYFSCLEEYFSDQRAFELGYQLYRPDTPWRENPDDLAEPVTCLYYTSVCGLLHATRLLLQKGADVNAQDNGKWGNALQAASERGHEEVVELLLLMGADVNAQGKGEWGNALQAASGRGHEVIVRMLLEFGADVNAQVRGEWGSALQAASGRGHKAVARLLLEAGADINAQDSIWGSALQAASGRGHEAIVRMLLEFGADVNAQGSVWGSALRAASGEGHKAIVRLLIERGADVNARDNERDDALLSASREGHEAVVRLLLAAGANLNVYSRRYENVLTSVSRQGYEGIVRLLLEENANISCYTSPYSREELLLRIQAKRKSRGNKRRYTSVPK